MVSGPLVWLSGLAVLVARAAAAAAGDDVVTSETFFYGQSPAVYPSRPLTRRSYDELSQADIPGPWIAAFQENLPEDCLTRKLSNGERSTS
ncbi:hypothetical protein E4U34_003919 [Claviceps purpurea]|nr:hypothetical protein E4U34_003919 [Claviceps purpurea]